MATTGLKQIHDLLLEQKPESASHDPSTCVLCKMEEEENAEGASMRTFSEDELQAAVEAATASLKSELNELKASAEAEAVQAQITAKVEEATSSLATQIADLQSRLDAAVIEAQNEKARADTLEAEKLAEAEKATVESRKAERLEKVREVANFPEQYLTENADRFAAMSDEDFQARLDEYRQIAVKATAEGLPSSAVVKATRESGAPAGHSALSEVIAMRRAGIDPRTLV